MITDRPDTTSYRGRKATNQPNKTRICVYEKLCSQQMLREVLWYKLLSRFGFNYFTVFISDSPERQIDLLFTGSREILIDEKDVLDCIKVLLMSLSKIPAKSRFII